MSPIERQLRAILAEVLDLDVVEIERLPLATPLFSEGLALDSLTGMELLAAIDAELGVDIAAEDLNLDSLQSIETLLDYISERRA